MPSWAELVQKNEHVLLAIRHGETVLNTEDRTATTTETPLTEKGRTQAHEASRALRGLVFDEVFSSPRERARETAEIMIGPVPITTDERMREPPAGPFEGEILSDLWAGTHPLHNEFAAMYAEPPVYPDGFESPRETAAKTAGFLDELGERPGRYLAFSHGGLLRIMAAAFVGLDPDRYGMLKLDNCHAIAIKWFPRPPHQLLAVNASPLFPVT